MLNKVKITKLIVFILMTTMSLSLVSTNAANADVSPTVLTEAGAKAMTNAQVVSYCGLVSDQKLNIWGSAVITAKVTNPACTAAFNTEYYFRTSGVNGTSAKYYSPRDQSMDVSFTTPVILPNKITKTLFVARLIVGKTIREGSIVLNLDGPTKEKYNQSATGDSQIVEQCGFSYSTSVSSDGRASLTSSVNTHDCYIAPVITYYPNLNQSIIKSESFTYDAKYKIREADLKLNVAPKPGTEITYSFQIIRKTSTSTSSFNFKTTSIAGVPIAVSTISINDINQGKNGDCWLLATIQGIVLNHPEMVADMITIDKDGNYRVRLYIFDTNTSQYVTKFHTVKLNEIKYLQEMTSFSENQKWVAILEIAFSKQYRASDWLLSDDTPYRNLITPTFDLFGIDGGNSDEVKSAFTAITGHSMLSANSSSIREELAKGHMIYTGTDSIYVREDTPEYIREDHAYTVISANEATITLRNPWGDGHGAKDGYFTMSWYDYDYYFADEILVGYFERLPADYDDLTETIDK